MLIHLLPGRSETEPDTQAARGDATAARVLWVGRLALEGGSALLSQPLGLSQGTWVASRPWSTSLRCSVYSAHGTRGPWGECGGRGLGKLLPGIAGGGGSGADPECCERSLRVAGQEDGH